MLAAIGALQLMPENADRGVRLEALAHIVAARRGRRARATTSRSRLRYICESPALRRLERFEDPFPNSFTENFTFFGGGFVVFPGRFNETTFVLRHLGMALFQSSEPFPDADFVAKTRALVAAVLAVSDEMARRARLTRGTSPPEGRASGIVVPGVDRLRRLKHAVTFRVSELERLLALYDVAPAALDCLITELGQVSISRYHLDGGDLFPRPLVRAGDRIIVALPEQVLAAARHAIVCGAVARGLTGVLASRYAEAVAFTSHESLVLLGHEPVPLQPADVPEIPVLGVGFRSLDTDTLLYVALLTDPLQKYGEDAVYADWDVQEFGPQLERHFREVAAAVKEEIAPAPKILCLLLVQGCGQAPLLAVRGADLPLTVAMSVADLQTIAWLPDRDRLTLWKFARAAARVRQHTFVYTMSLLDEYEWYRRNKQSYGFTDGDAQSALVLFPVGAGRLRREVVQTFDPHAVAGYARGSIVEVVRLYGTDGAPMAHPARLALSTSAPVAIVVEGGKLPIWITGPLDQPVDDVLRPLYVEITDAIAYWLWRCAPVLAALLDPLAAAGFVRLHLELRLADADTWVRPWTGVQDNGAVLFVESEQAEARLDIVLLPAARALFAWLDNAGERALLHEIFGEVRKLLPDRGVWLDNEITAAIDSYLPLSDRKRIVALDFGAAPEFDPRGLPRYRSVCDADTAEWLDELAIELKALGLPTGAVADEHRRQLAQRVVAFLYSQLEALIASLDPDGLLEQLITRHEAVVHANAAYELQAHNPSGLGRAHLGDWAVELSASTATAMASRFLLEYAAARPAAGSRVLSLGTYDRLLALAALIIEWGLLGDLIAYGIANIGVELWPLGRIRLDRYQYTRASAAYLAVVTQRVLPSTAAFLSQYTGVETRPALSELEMRFERAAAAEWGFGLSEIVAFIDEATLLGNEYSNLVVVLARDSFTADLAQRLAWSPQRTGQALELLSLSPRDDFLEPPSGHPKADVYPWRFNRSLSYARRPFVVRRHGDAEEVIWGPRHLSVARRHLLRLCFERRLQAKSREMRQLLGELNASAGTTFNDEVANVLRGHADLVVRTRVARVGKHYVPGDVDVLVLDRRRRVLVIECKVMAISRTPHELRTELGRLFRGSDNHPSAIARHRTRVTWIIDHLDMVLDEFGVDDTDHWTVEGMIVVDTELLSPFLEPSQIPVVPIIELSRILNSSRTTS